MKLSGKKSIIFILSLFIVQTLSIPYAQADPAVMIQGYTMSPEILMPGDTAVLTLQVKNGENVATETSSIVTGGETTSVVHSLGVAIDNIKIVAAHEGGKRIYATTAYDDIGYLAPGASIDVSFKLLVDSNMSEGIYFPTVEIDVRGGIDVHYPLLMKVSNSSVDLLRTDIPSKISKGGTTEIIVTAVNKRENAVHEVLITPYGEDVEFIPSSYFIGSLGARTSEDVVFSIKPLAEGFCDLNFNLSYHNGDNQHTNQLIVPISVIQALDIAPIITNYPISITKSGSSRVTVEVYNAKTDKITGVLVTPQCNATVIPSQYFIGSMDPDDVFSASFDVHTGTLELGTYSIGFLVSFKQGNDYYEIPIVSKTFDIVSGTGINYQTSGGSNDQTSTNGLFQPSSLMTCVLSFILIVIVLVIIVIYLRRRKRRNET